jgi:type I restriction enzyme S subunit
MEKLQPKLRFPEFEDEWQKKNFKEIFSFKSTNSFSRDKLNYDAGSVKNIHYGDIHTKFKTLFDIDKEIVPYINEDVSIERISKDNYLKVGDLIIADASEDYDDIGKCIEVINLGKSNVLAGLHTFIARPDIFKMSIGFNGYLMKSEKTKLQIKTIAQGSKVLSLSTTRLSDIILDIPSNKEQTRIANFLSLIDEKITLLKEKKADLQEYKKGIMQKIFSQEIRFKDDNGEKFKEWEEKTLGEIGSVLNGLTYSPEDISDKGVLVLRSSNIKDSRLKFEDNVYVNKDNFTAVVVNDILICVRNGSRNLIGKNTLITKEIEGVAFGAFMSIYRSDYNDFLIHWFNSEDYFKNVNLNLGATINSINGSNLKKFKIPFPSKPEQTRIAQFISLIDEKISLVSSQIEETLEYKKGLLQQMFV